MKLNEERIRYIIKARERGKSSSDIASILLISRSRVEQVYSYHKKHGYAPSLHKAGRKKKPIRDEEIQVILNAFKRYRVGASYLKKVIEEKNGMHINHDRILQVLKMHNLASEPRRWIRKNWVRYERAYSNSLWHADWYEIKDGRWKGMQLIVYEGDASRFVVGYGLFREATSYNAVEVLRQAMERYGRPTFVITDCIASNTVGSLATLILTTERYLQKK